MKLTIKAASTEAGVCPSVVYGWVSDRLLPVYRLGGKGKRGKILIDDADLNAFLSSCRVEAVKLASSPASRPRAIKLRHLRLPS
jgi:hypothetical protein